jgi:hypothetical protein
MSTTPDILRQRATTLRRLATTLTSSSLHTLGSAVGEDTWMGPSPQHCRERVAHFHDVFLGHADDLRSRARRLERQAEQIESTELRRTSGPI